jgi:hypothetical protein
MIPTGLADKLYWRGGMSGLWHCFKRREGGVYISLCGHFELKRSGGQACSRPQPTLRCTRCDIAEMKRRGKEESLPANE